jgi:hypothetical protein
MTAIATSLTLLGVLFFSMTLASYSEIISKVASRFFRYFWSFCGHFYAFVLIFSFEVTMQQFWL